LTVWERSFRGHYTSSSSSPSNGSESSAEISDEHNTALSALTHFTHVFKTTARLNAHLAPLWGLITRILHIPLHDAAYLFLFSHARTVVSAAVRANVLGPYQAQSVLGSGELQLRIRELVEEGWERCPEDAGQCVPVMDLWVGRHEKLYSRIFNS
jgi:urease accessory protein